MTQQIRKRESIREQLAAMRAMFALSWRIERTACVALISLSVANATVVSLSGLAQRWLVDAVHTHGAGLGAAVVLGVASAAMVLTIGTVAANLGFQIGDRVDLAVNEQVLAGTGGIATLEHLERPEYLDRLTLLRTNTRALASALPNLLAALSAVISATLSIILLVQVNSLLALMVLLALPPLWSDARGRQAQREARERGAEPQRLEAMLHEMCTTAEPAKEVRVTGAGPILSGEADRWWAAAFEAQVAAQRAALGWNLAGWSCFTVGYVAALALVAHLVITGRASLGDLVMVVSLGAALRGQVRSAVTGVSQMAEGGDVSAHYLWFLRYLAKQHQAAGAPVPERIKHGITLKDVGFTYPGADAPVLRNVNLTLTGGSTIALVGVNGAGKTTLVKLLTGMYTPTEGIIEIDGVPLDKLDPAQWRKRISAAFQDFVKFELPVKHTVGAGDLERLGDVQAVTDAIGRAGATSIVENLPEGLDTQLGRIHEGTELSHGQWQRIALARGLMREAPAAMFLDEPTAALDPQAEHDLYERFTTEVNATDGAITLLVSHRFSTVRMANHIIVVDDNHIAEQGSHAELMARGGVYAKAYTAQARSYA